MHQITAGEWIMVLRLTILSQLHTVDNRGSEWRLFWTA